MNPVPSLAPFPPGMISRRRFLASGVTLSGALLLPAAWVAKGSQDAGFALRTDQSPDAGPILNRMIDALGGMAAWRKITDATYLEHHWHYDPETGAANDRVRRIYFQQPRAGKYLVRLEQEGDRSGGTDRIVEGFDGEQYWRTINNNRVNDLQVLKTSQREVQSAIFWFSFPFNFREINATFSSLGVEPVGNESAYVVKAVLKDEPSWNPLDQFDFRTFLLYVGQSDYRPLQLYYWRPGEERPEQWFRFGLSEYRKVGGILRDLHRLYWNHRGEKVAEKIWEIQGVNTGLPNALFLRTQG